MQVHSLTEADEYDEIFAAVVVPANAYPTYKSYGTGWKCKRGYKADGDTCAEVKVPPHAYLTAAGDEWKCDRGYTEKGTSCVKLDLPVHAHIDFSGNGWDCDMGYLERGDQCILPQSDS